MDWKDGLTAAAIVGLGYLGITSITKEKDEEESNDCPFCSGKIDFEEAYIELHPSLCDGCYDAVMEKRHDHAYSAESFSAKGMPGNYGICGFPNKTGGICQRMVVLGRACGAHKKFIPEVTKEDLARQKEYQKTKQKIAARRRREQKRLNQQSNEPAPHIMTKTTTKERAKETADLLEWAKKQDWDAESFSENEYVDGSFVPRGNRKEGFTFYCAACDTRLPLKLRNRSLKIAQEFGMGTGEICRPCVKGIKKLDYISLSAESFSADLYKGQPCPHEWEEDKVKDWGDGVFTIYVSCKNCGTKSYIEGHADEHSESHLSPITPFSAESFSANDSCKGEPYEHSMSGDWEKVKHLKNLHDWSNVDEDGFSYCGKCGQYYSPETGIVSDEKYQDLVHGEAWWAESFSAEKGYRNYGGERWDKITRILVRDEVDVVQNGMNRTQALKTIPPNSEVKKWLRVKRTKEWPGNGRNEYYYYWGLINPEWLKARKKAESFAAEAFEDGSFTIPCPRCGEMTLTLTEDLGNRQYYTCTECNQDSPMDFSWERDEVLEEALLTMDKEELIWIIMGNRVGLLQGNYSFAADEEFSAPLAIPPMLTYEDYSKYEGELENIDGRQHFFTYLNMARHAYNALYVAAREKGLTPQEAFTFCTSKWLRHNEEDIELHIEQMWATMFSKDEAIEYADKVIAIESVPRTELWTRVGDYAKLRKEIHEQFYDAESHAYSYAYNEGHSDSRKTGEYRPSLSTGSQEASFKRILKQKGD